MAGKVKTATRTTETVITDEVKVVALDASTADLLARFEANKANKKLLEDEYAILQAEIYGKLGYTKYADKWIGTAEEGTIAGVGVVKVATQSRKNFQVDKFVVAHPELLSEVERYTEVSTFTVLKTVR